MNTVFTNILKPFLVKSYSLRHLRNVKDPGIRRRAAIIQQNLESDDNLEELEADFFDLSKSHKQHEREVEASRELHKYHIVKQKYFKEKLPNFLTWADKQQIQYLHSSNPEEWTVERLSEGFPALPDIISKIIKNKWVPKNANRVKKHDEAVQQNWHLFKKEKEKLKLPADVIAHLRKFTSRDLNLNPDLSELQVEDVSKRELVKKGGEFSNIIQSYEALKMKNVDKQISQQKLLPGTNQTSIVESNTQLVNTQQDDINLKSKKWTKVMTHDQLEKQLSHGKSLSPKSESDLVIKSNEGEETSETKEITLQPEELNFKVTKFKSPEQQFNLYKPKRDYLNLMYPQRINIPAAKRKRGYTYKLNDCFYDSDGTFLYRVPGML